MKRAVIMIDGMEYPLDTTLRVAYRIQGINNHKPYTQVFSGLGDMLLEKQIEILYTSFQIANPEAAKTYAWPKFLNYCLEHFTLKEIMDLLRTVIEAVLGTDSDAPDRGAGDQGN